MQNNNKSSGAEDYFEGKNGKAVLIIHGFGGHVSQTDILVEYLHGKGHTVVRPVLKGHRDYTDLHKCEPGDWICEIDYWINNLSNKFDSIYLIGISFGGNLALLKATANNPKIKGIITMETPIYFNSKIAFMLNVVQPVLDFFNIEKIRKNRFWYRKNYADPRDKSVSCPFIPVKTVGLVNKYVQECRKQISFVKVPVLAVQAEDSDLICKKSADYIVDNCSSAIKEKYLVPINNHDLDLMDESGKILMLQKINSFIERV